MKDYNDDDDGVGDDNGGGGDGVDAVVSGGDLSPDTGVKEGEAE